MARFGPAFPFVIACGGIAAFSLMDALMKEASMAVGALTALFWRNALGSLAAGPLWLAVGRRRPNRAALMLHLRRSIVVAAMAFLFFWALARLPMAETIAISFISPVIALVLAALLLGERVGRPAILASLFAVAGMAVIVTGRLKGDYDGTALAAIGAVLLSAALYAYNLVLARQQALIALPFEIAFFQTLFVALFLIPFLPWIGWPGSAPVWGAVAGAALLALGALAMLAWAYARAEAQAIIPVEYTGFVWAALFGWLLFDEKPGPAVLLGAGLIVVGSLIAARAKPETARTEPQEL